MSLGCMTAMIDRVATVINGTVATQTATSTVAKKHE